MALLVILVTLLAVTVSSNPLQSNENPKTTRVETSSDVDYRLPGNTVPLHYVVKLVPYIVEGNFTFDGEVEVQVKVNEATTSIVLHAHRLEIDNDTVTVTSSNGSTVSVANKTYNEDLHFYTLSFSSNLSTGNYSIHFSYQGELDDDMYGFYRSYYNTSDGVKTWLASTQFEPVYARRAFPCFDEPALKATFNISIAHFKNQSAVSNMPVLTTSVEDSSIGGRIWTTFETTPPMSTYLVAFVVSDFGTISNSDGSFKVWSRPDALDTANYSLIVGEQELDWLSNFTDYNFYNALPTMNQFAIPDFSAGAMENWGIVTYRERLLLWKTGVSTTRNKQNVATTISHEFAHQWFGNLVGPAWWKYLWLNEGFATYFEYYATAQVETTWRLMEQFLLDNNHAALLTDSLDTSHPMNENVSSPSEISAIFDTISYQKGGAILRMLSHILTEEVFQEGLRIYLQNMAYKAATPDNLWEALETASNANNNTGLQTHVVIKTVMDTWTEQKGYPLVTVIRNYTIRTQEVTQERFLLKGRDSSTDSTEYRWWVPINFVSQTNPNFTDTSTTDWIRSQDESIMVSTSFEPTDWVIYNVQQTGYYRVNYDVTNWYLIINYLMTTNYEKIHVLNRAQLLDDSMNLARAGYLDYSVALNLTSYLTRELDFIPWQAAFTGFAYLNRMLANSTGYENFQTYILHLTSPLQENLTFAELDTDDHVSKLNRLNVLSWACQMGLKSCVSKAEELLLAYYSSEDPDNYEGSADLKAWYYCEGLRNANYSVWEFLWKRYLATDLSTEQTLILTSLGCSQNVDILNSYLQLSITENSGIRSQDTYSVFTAVYSGSPSNINVAFNFLVANWEAISTFYGGMSSISNMLSGLAGRMVNAEQVANLKAFVTDNADGLGSAASAAERAIELAEENLIWLNNYEDDILDWLSSWVAENEASDSTDGSGASPVIISSCLTVFTLTLLRIL